LRSHVTCAMNGSKSKATNIRFPVTCNLIVNGVLCPLGSDIPTHVCNPVLCSNSRDSTISITREVEHLIFSFELLINPLGSFGLNDVSNFCSAEIPCMDFVRNVKSLTNIISVEICEHRVTPRARRKFIGT